MKRGELAKLAGCNGETVRYYEKIGLLPNPVRTESGYRIYKQHDLQRLSFILRSRNLGFTVDEIRELLSVSDNKAFSCNQVQDIAERHLCDIEKRIEDLSRIQKTLKNMLAECKNGANTACHIIDTLSNQTH